MEPFLPLWTLGLALGVAAILVGWLILEVEALDQEDGL